MATSQQQWRHGSQLLLLAAALALVLLIAAGSADAAVCNPPWRDCHGTCKNLKTDKYNCGWCNRVCPYPSGGRAYCDNGNCRSCPAGWHYDFHLHRCVRNT